MPVQAAADPPVVPGESDGAADSDGASLSGGWVGRSSLCAGVAGGSVSTDAEAGASDGGADPPPGVSLPGDDGPGPPAQPATTAAMATSTAKSRAPER